MKKYFFFALTAAMMSFAGCQEMEQEAPVNPNESGSTFEFVADIAQTKTTLDVENGYKVDWEDGDVVYMVTSDGTWGAAYGDDQDAKTIAEFKYADGKFTSEATIANGKYTFKGMYEAASQKSFHRGASSTHKLEATQAQNCANPTAHIKANDALVGTFTATVPMAEMAKMNMSHLYTLMQVNVKNVTGAPIVVTKFEMTAEGADLAAIFNVTAFDSPAITTKEKESSTITVNLTGGSVENNASLPVYFVMAPLKDYAGDVTFKVTDSEGNTYTKTVTMNGITFEAGKYNTTPYAIKEADELPADVYGLVEVDGAFEDGGKYVLAFKDGNDGTFAFINSKGTSGTAVKNALEVTSGTIVNPSSDYVFTAVKSGDGFNFKNSAGKYIYNNGSNTTLNTNSTTATVWKPTFLTASSTYKLVATRYIAFNGSNKAMGYDISNFKDQVADGLALAQFAGAISVFKLNYIPVVTPKILVAETNVTALADSEYVEIPYSTENVNGVISAVVTSDVDGMVSALPVVESRKVIVYLNANETDNEKSASITLSYDGAEDVVISISQYAAASIEEGLESLYETVTSTNSATPDEFVINVTNAVVTYVNGSAAFIEDETAGMQIYMTSHGLNAGDKLTGTLTGKAFVRYGVCQISDYDFVGSKVSGATIPVSIITISDLLADYKSYVSRRVKIENATVADAVSGTIDKNGKVSQGENIINLYNNNSSVSFVADDVVDFVAYPSYHNTDKQLATYESPVSKKVAAPSISCSNNEVTITCSTAGATIYYAIGDAEYSVYEPFNINADCTVRAYAAKEGLIDSEVVTVNLTYVDPNAGGGEVVYVTDILTRATTGVTGSNYKDWTYESTITSAKYAGNSAGGNESIQLRSNNSNSGVVTTTSGGFAKKISVKWNSNTDDARILQVYAKNTPYDNAADLYDESTSGTLLGTIDKASATELTINGDYQYVGLRSKSGAMYLSEIQIVWDSANEGGGETPEPVQLTMSDITCSVQTANSLTFEWSAVANASNYEVTFNNGTPETVDATKYEATGLQAGTSYTISVKAVGDGVNYTTSPAGTAEGTTKEAQQPGQGGGNEGGTADPVTLIIDGSTLTSTATTADTDHTFGGVTLTMSKGAKYINSGKATNAFSKNASIFIGKTGAYIYNKTPIPGKIIKFEIYANEGASAKVSVGVNFSSTQLSKYNSSASNTYTNTLSIVNSVYDCSDKLPDDAQYFWYQVTNNNNSQVQFRITYIPEK